MEIKRRFNFKICYCILYVISFLIFLGIGLQPAEAFDNVSSQLMIPSINLFSDVVDLELKDHKLNTPDLLVGSYSRSQNKTLLIGHSSSVFKNLFEVKIGDSITYNNKNYTVSEINTVKKEYISMHKILAKADVDTIVLMTCTGTPLPNADATHRLIITALSE